MKKRKKAERKWILDPEGYVQKNEGFKYKSRIVERTEKDENGEHHVFKVM